MSGRPSSYREEFVEQAYKLALLGLTDAEMANFFQVTEKTLNNWKDAHPAFLQSLTRGKEIADANVAEKLYKRAMGYEHPDVHVSNYQGEITVTPLVRHYPPDTQAASLWLRNRQSGKWRERREVDATIRRDVTEFTDDELVSIIRSGRVIGETPSATDSSKLH